MPYRTVYDLLREPPALIPLAFAAISAVRLYLGWKHQGPPKIPLGRFVTTAAQQASVFMLIVWICITLVAVIPIAIAVVEVPPRIALWEGTTQVREGIVSELHSTAAVTGGRDSFLVDGYPYSFSRSLLGPGLRPALRPEDFVKRGDHVRVHSLVREDHGVNYNLVLRLEVADRTSPGE